ncbi:MAG: Hpt domain-containing protein [Rhodocyclales bacterium]|nr:Hpt domain-containing protein [Rhodocyclales bacterium]
MAVDMSQFHPVFFEEAAEYIATAEALLLYMDPEDPDPQQIDDLFRAVHSVKGSSGTLGFKAMAGLTQRMQSLIEVVREDPHRLSEDVLAALVHACRVLKALLAARRGGAQEDAEAAALAGVRLTRLAEGGEAAVPIPLEPPVAAPRRDYAAVAGELRELADRAATAAREIVQLVRHSEEEDADLAREAEESIGDVMSSLRRLEGVVVGMAAGASGVEARAIAAAVRHLGEAIRENEQRVRQGTQSAAKLRRRFETLAQAVAGFALPGEAGARPPAQGGARPRAPLPKFRRVAGTADGKEWPDF